MFTLKHFKVQAVRIFNVAKTFTRGYGVFAMDTYLSLVDASVDDKIKQIDFTMIYIKKTHPQYLVDMYGLLMRICAEELLHLKYNCTYLLFGCQTLRRCLATCIPQKDEQYNICENRVCSLTERPRMEICRHRGLGRVIVIWNKSMISYTLM